MARVFQLFRYYPYENETHEVKDGSLKDIHYWLLNYPNEYLDDLTIIEGPVVDIDLLLSEMGLRRDMGKARIW